MDSKLNADYDVDIGGTDTDSAKARFEGIIEAIRRPENSSAVRRLPNGRAIVRISNVAGKRADQSAVSFGNWHWSIAPGTSS